MQNHELGNMTEGKPVRLMLSFALPLMLGNVCQQLYTVTDTAIVGRGVGLEALAALGSVDWLGFLLFGTAQGFTQGFSIKMSQQYGAGNLSGLKKTIGVSAVLSFVIAVLSTFLGLELLPGFLRLLAVPGELYEMAYLYMAILFGGVMHVSGMSFTADVSVDSGVVLDDNGMSSLLKVSAA